MTYLQSAYPSGTGTESAVVRDSGAVWGTLTTDPGVHGYNAGESGTTAATYLNSTEIINVASLNPRAVFHMVGSNDFKNGVAPATYKAQMQNVIASLKAQITGPCVHVLIQPYERYDVGFTPTYAWADYGNALKEIAAEDPVNVAYIDISDAFYNIGIPGDDPFDFMAADRIHMVDLGHGFMADQLRQTLNIAGSGSSSGSSGPSGTPTATIVASDTFSGPNAPSIIGRETDNLLGGTTGKTWIGDVNGTAISNNAMVRGSLTSTYFTGFADTTPDCEISFIVTTKPTAADFFVDLHRQQPNGSGTPDAYRVQVKSDGTMLMSKRVNNSSTTLSSIFAYVDGDRLALRYYQGVISLWRNGFAISSAADSSVSAPGWTGIIVTNSGAGYVLDDFIYSEIALA